MSGDGWDELVMMCGERGKQGEVTYRVRVGEVGGGRGSQCSGDQANQVRKTAARERHPEHEAGMRRVRINKPRYSVFSILT